MTSIDIQQSVFEHAIPGAKNTGAHSRAEAGILFGQQFVLANGYSMLDGSAEELSLFLSHTSGDRVESKGFKDLRWTAGQGELTPDMEEVESFLSAVKLDPKQLAVLAQRMQSGQGQPRELARDQFQDAAGQFMLLRYVLLDGERKGLPEQALDKLRDAIADLELESGAQIRASLNTIGVAAAYGGEGKNIENFQSAYQDTVLGNATLAQTLKLLLERLGGDNGTDLSDGIKTMVKALGADISASRPSTDVTRLQALVQDFYHLAVASTVLERCDQLAVALKQKHECGGVNPGALMRELVSLTAEKWVSAQRFSALVTRFAVDKLEAEIAFLAGTQAMLKGLPVKVFDNMDNRQALLDASQDALDQAIDREDGQ